jgi:predicted lipid-binding transport protein (Tim44 family)
MFSRRRIQLLGLLGTFAVALFIWSSDADARAGRGSSFGSRGARTYTAPPPTATAPNAAAPINRSMTQPGQPGQAAAARAPGAAAGGGLFNRPGLLGGLAAGFLGAGLIGLLMGNGLLGGLTGMASFLGLLLQIGLVAIVAALIWSWWQRRNAPAPAAVGLSPRQLADAYDRPRSEFLSGGGAPAAGPVSIEQSDYEAFERLLGEIQTAYGREDLNALRERVTPEMLSYFNDDLSHYASRGVTNAVSDVKLLQGDLADAWREGDAEYASVAMRFSLVDRMVERASGRPVDGDGAEPVEATEIWTFMRAHGGAWLLSAIQQVDAQKQSRLATVH